MPSKHYGSDVVSLTPAGSVMTNEEVERAMQFILQQQAQFWTSVQSLEGSVRENAALLAQLTRRTDGLADHFGELTGRFSELTGRFSELTALVLRLGRIVEEQGRRMDRTDDRLNALIATVDRYISRHNDNN